MVGQQLIQVTMCTDFVDGRMYRLTSQPSVKVAVQVSTVTGQKKSWGIGSRYREQLEAQKQNKATGVASSQSSGKSSPAVDDMLRSDAVANSCVCRDSS